MVFPCNMYLFHKYIAVPVNSTFIKGRKQYFSCFIFFSNKYSRCRSSWSWAVPNRLISLLKNISCKEKYRIFIVWYVWPMYFKRKQTNWLAFALPSVINDRIEINPWKNIPAHWFQELRQKKLNIYKYWKNKIICQSFLVIYMLKICFYCWLSCFKIIHRFQYRFSSKTERTCRLACSSESQWLFLNPDLQLHACFLGLGFKPHSNYKLLLNSILTRFTLILI